MKITLVFAKEMEWTKGAIHHVTFRGGQPEDFSDQVGEKYTIKLRDPDYMGIRYGNGSIFGFRIVRKS